MTNNRFLETANKWKNDKLSFDEGIDIEEIILPPISPNLKDVLVFSSTNGIFILDKDYSVKPIMELETFAFSMCSHQGRIYITRFNDIVDLFEDKVVYRRKNEINSLISYKSELYTGEEVELNDTKTNEFYNVTQNKLIASRGDHFASNVFCIHNGELYDAGFKEIFKTLENKVVAEREGRPWNLCSAKGVLYDYGSYHQIFDTLNNKLLISTNEDRWCEHLFSFDENLYLHWEKKIYDPFTGKTVMKLPEEMMACFIHPREFFVQNGVLI